jgi:hypothetical protein
MIDVSHIAPEALMELIDDLIYIPFGLLFFNTAFI